MGILRDHYHQHTHKAGDVNVEVHVPESNPQDAARYADEMLTVAKDRILAHLVVEDNTLSIEGVVFQISNMTREVEVHAVFAINSERFDVVKRCPVPYDTEFGGMSMDLKAKLAASLLDAILAEVHSKLFNNVLDSMLAR